MKLSPLDIKRHRFEKGFRGYDPDEVDGFLKQVADQFESLQEELRLAQDRMRETEGKLQHYERVELALQEALESAKESAKRTAEDAERRAAVVVEEAELRAQQIIQDVERERFGMRQDLVKLSARQAEVAARLRGFLVSELQILSDFQGDDAHGLLQLDAAPRLSDGADALDLGDAPEGPGEAEAAADATEASGADDATWTDLADLPATEAAVAAPTDAEETAPTVDASIPEVEPPPAAFVPPPPGSFTPPATDGVLSGRVVISSRADETPEPLAPDESGVVGEATPVSEGEAGAPYPPPGDWAAPANVAGSEAERERIRRILEDLD